MHDIHACFIQSSLFQEIITNHILVVYIIHSIIYLSKFQPLGGGGGGGEEFGVRGEASFVLPSLR